MLISAEAALKLCVVVVQNGVLHMRRDSTSRLVDCLIFHAVNFTIDSIVCGVWQLGCGNPDVHNCEQIYWKDTGIWLFAHRDVAIYKGDVCGYCIFKLLEGFYRIP